MAQRSRSSTSTTGEPKISIEGLEKIYNPESIDPTKALVGVDIDIYENEFVSIIGPSGCGKTTLLKCLGDITEPTAGRIRVDGEDAASARKHNNVSFFFQEDVLLPWRSVMENVLLPLEVQGEDISDESVRQRATDILETVGLGGFENNSPSELSGGMRQRVALARGFVYDPEIFLMDEPFAALDELTRRKMNSELLRIHQAIQKMTVFVTHHIAEAVWLSDRVVVLSPRPGEVHEILDIDLPRPRSEETRSDPAFVEYQEYLTDVVMELDVT